MKDNKLPQKMKGCSNQDLKKMLYEELDKEQPDRETALRVLDELEKRENQKQNSYRRKTPKWTWKAAIAAVVVLSFAFGAPPVFGAENIFQLVGRWTKDIFVLRNPNEMGYSEPEYVFTTDHPGLQQLYDAVIRRGVTQRIVPTWMPEGFQLKEMKDFSDLNGPSFLAVFAQDSESVIFTISPTNTVLNGKYPKSDESVIVYEAAGVKHYLVLNEGTWTTVWSADTIECSFIATIDIDTICCIINSIYTEEN